MIRFECDYLEGAHPLIMEALAATNLQQTPGYGEDRYCESAREKIRAAIGDPSANVHFLVGGTQANLTLIAAALRPWQGVICADTGHIAVHETGAVEATGHKVIPLANTNGKISAAQIAKCVDEHFADSTHEHMVQPAMVYVSQSTETGTLYSLSELTEIRKVTKERGLLLYVDGARLGYALASEANDVGLNDLSKLADAFYIGGTKVGALFGEAMVIMNPELNRDFRYIIKQRGGMLAKGRLLGIQFDTLFTDGLYVKIASHAIRLASRVRTALTESGFEFYAASPTNQLFPILTNAEYERLSNDYSLSFWARVDENRVAVRICTSWATTEENTEQLINDLKALRA